MRLGVGVGLNVVVSMATGATVGGWLGARVVDGAGGTAAERRVGACVGALVGVVAAVFVEGTLVVVRLYAADVVEQRVNDARRSRRGVRRRRCAGEARALRVGGGWTRRMASCCSGQDLSYFLLSILIRAGSPPPVTWP